MFDQLADLLKTLGIDPALAGIGVLLAILLRYARGMMRWMNSGWTYVAAFAFGALGAWLKTDNSPKAFTLATLSIACIVLVSQKLIETAAAKVSWLPQDNEWVASTKEVKK